MRIAHQLLNRKYLLGVMVLIVVSVFLLADRLGGVPNHADTNVIAAYNDGVITKEQIVAHYRMQPAENRQVLRSLDGLQHVVQDLAVHAVVERWAQERQVDTKESFKRAMKNAADSVTLYDVAKQMHEFDVKVEESEIQKYFDDNRAQFAGSSLTQVKEQIRTVLHAQKEQQVIEDFLKELHVNANISVNANLLEVSEPIDAELQAYYQNNVERFREVDRVRVDEIRTTAKDKADRALARIQAGEEFSQVALEINEPSFEPNPEFVSRGARGAAFDANTFILDEAQVSKVFQDGISFVLVRVAEKRAGRVKSFDEARSQIAATLRAEREKSYFAEKKNEILFTLNAVRYTLGDFREEYDALSPSLRAQYASREAQRRLLDAIIDRLLVLQSVPSRMAQSKNQSEMDETRRHVLAQILHEEEMEGKLDVTDQEIAEHYQANPSHYATSPKAKISYVRVGRGTDSASQQTARQKIETAYSRLRPAAPWQTGEDFAIVAQQVSEDAETAKNGGALDNWIEHPHDLIVDIDTLMFLDTILSLKHGEISPPFAHGDSYYIVLVREKVEAQAQPLDQVRELVRADVRDVKHRQALGRFEGELMQRMGLKIHEDRLIELLKELELP
ncbi:MAG: peptidyl-prolyl cis-trans isomerase [Chloroflexi bacterium]|nr:peptidyl-prolyl cis-trans isomerase [Chloroflexota bacterium]